MSFAATARIDHGALQHNFDRVREIAPRSRVLAVIKADAYGHGAVTAARALPDADGFAVARLSEALALRAAGIAQRIVLLEGHLHAEELPAARQHNLDLVIHDDSQITALQHLPANARFALWLKIDTGMGRLGFAPERLVEVADRLAARQRTEEPLRIMTHLANADDPGDPASTAQLARLNAVLPGGNYELSVANSAGVLAWPAAHAGWVRPGLMLYGISPIVGRRGADHDLRAVMRFATRLIAVKRLAAGERVGYGGTWRCPEDMPIGIAAAGYADGYPRHAQSGTPVVLSGRRVPLIGRVSMDMIAVDLRTAPEARAGDEAVLWGPELPVEEIADAAGTIPYELVCRVAPRVPRIAG